ncbi:hypothetical protein [Nocardioides sp. SYSU DS0663]|uniref:hypothetical protein n=1 Tax=Nocardioides sp. SYSU DS0663 TaxID=3416445 RepID=UPI003F4C2E16
MHAAGPGLTEPLPRELARLLRRAVLEHALAERRRVHPPVLHVGVPGGPERLLAVRPEDRTDHGLRTDVVAALLAAVRRAEPARAPLVWLTRPGPLDLQDVDVQWAAAARAAFAEAGVPLVLVVANRKGWRDPLTGTERTWQRLRRR